MPVGSNEVVSLDTRLSASERQLCDVLLLDAESRQALTIMRALGRHGLRVAALAGENVSVPGFSSRWCQQRFVSPACENAEAYGEYVTQVVQKTRPYTLIASAPGTISLLRQHRAHLEQYTHIMLPEESVLRIVTDKRSMLEIARGLGFNLPKGVQVREISEMAEALRFVGLPAVVRPVRVWAPRERVGLEPVLVTTPAEAQLSAEAILNAGKEVLFQQFFPGMQESLCFLMEQGEILAQFAYRTKRSSSPAGGLDVVRYSIAMPEDSSIQAASLLKKIEMEGYCRFDFRRDYAGKPYLIDIDPCLSAGIDLAIQAGIDFPYLLYQWNKGEHIEKIRDYHIGAYRRDLAADFAATMAIVRQRGKPGIIPARRAVRDFLVSFFIPMHYDYFDRQDLYPVWASIRACFDGTYARKMVR